MLRLDGWSALVYRWTSPTWQFANLPNARGALQPAVRAVVTSDEEPLAKAACRQGFWKLDATFLRSLGQLQGVPFAGKATILEMLVSLIKHNLQVDDFQALGFVKHRVANQDAGMQFLQEVAELDEAMEVVDRHDVQAIEAHRKTARKSVDEHKSFVAEFGDRVRKAAPPQPKAKNKSRQRAGVGRGNADAKPDRIPLDIAIPQAEAKLYIPDGSHIWVDKFGGSWQGHLAPFPQVGRSFARHTEDGALRLVIAYLWEKFCLSEGIPKERCPMQGVFPPEAGGASSSGVAAQA